MIDNTGRNKQGIIDQSMNTPEYIKEEPVEYTVVPPSRSSNVSSFDPRQEQVAERIYGNTESRQRSLGNSAPRYEQEVKEYRGDKELKL